MKAIFGPVGGIAPIIWIFLAAGLIGVGYLHAIRGQSVSHSGSSMAVVDSGAAFWSSPEGSSSGGKGSGGQSAGAADCGSK
ncbi:MAG: hypothetical protein ABSG51_11070 [Terracidiphilus sp.]|jgi:hypothetical protein